MQQKFKKYSLVVCLFVFLFVIIGGGFHLSLGGAFLGALSGTPVVIHVFERWCRTRLQEQRARRDRPAGDNSPERTVIGL
jgi:hypothetical protein